MSLDLNLESIILLLFFIAPGFVFTRTYTAYRPRYYREPTAFEQFVLAIIGSTIIHAAVLTIFALAMLIYWWFTNQLLYLNTTVNLATPLSSYNLPTLISLIFVGIVYLFLSMVLARRFASFLGRGTPADRPRWWTFTLGEDPPEPFLLWHTILQIEALQLDLIPPHLTVKMRSGEYFEGDLYRMRMVGDEENTVELALQNVYYSPTAPPNGGTQSLKSLASQIVLLKSTDILWLTRNDIPR
jgi:hypothetical protein